MPKYKVIIPTNLKPSPAAYELSAATLLANHFETDVEFILRSNRKTPDFLIDGVRWELKSPISKIRSELSRKIKRVKSIHRLILIEKGKSIFEITR